jgi:hypothetical protein
VRWASKSALTGDLLPARALHHTGRRLRSRGPSQCQLGGSCQAPLGGLRHHSGGRANPAGLRGTPDGKPSSGRRPAQHRQPGSTRPSTYNALRGQVRTPTFCARRVTRSTSSSPARQSRRKPGLLDPCRRGSPSCFPRSKSGSLPTPPGWQKFPRLDQFDHFINDRRDSA